MSAVPMQRREFLKFSLAASGGLLIGFVVPEANKLFAEDASPQGFMPNAFVRIGKDERITVIVNHSEMGQGVYTSLPMLLADELDADWSKIGFEPAPVDAKYNHPVFKMQMTGGSTSVASSFLQYRMAGAAARALLLTAAAQKFGVARDSLVAKDGVITDAAGHRATYGELAEAAAKLPPPSNAPMKEQQSLRIIGKPLKRLDTAAKVNGTAEFGFDVKLPNMVNAVVLRSPVFGGKVKSFDDSKARTMPGVKKIVQVPSGVAVIADTFWHAKTARDALRVSWDPGEMGNFSTQQMIEDYRHRATTPGQSVRKDGDPDGTLQSAGKKIEAVYEVPFVPHAMMEPLNCVVDLKSDSCDVWTGTQFQTVDRANAAKTAGLPPEKVQVHTTFLGGGFGRRANPHSDFVVEAVNVAKAAGAPVKVIWTREDDMQGGYYRPAFLHAISGAIDSDGKPVAWRSRVVGQSIMQGTPFEAMMSKGFDPSSVEGVDDLPYSIPNLGVELHSPKLGVPVQWWRSVGHSHTAFATECFVDELAHLAGKDPYEFRVAMLDKAPRHLGVLKLAAEKAGWGQPLPAGVGRGIAVHQSFDSYNAQVAEVSIENGQPRIHRIVSVIDCGRTVNPNIIEAQLQGGAIFAASAALYQELTFERGVLQQTNFHNFGFVRMNDAPKVEVYIVSSNEKPTGVGEPGVPCTAPAIANAIFAATGKRVRRLPIRMTEAL